MFGRPSFRNDQSGATAVEFAFVASMLVISIVFIMAAALTLYYNQAIDSATQRAAREIMLGNIQNASIGKDAFRTDYVCPKLPSNFNCNDVIVNVQTVDKVSAPGGYFALINYNQTALLMPASNGDAQYSPGLQQSYEYVQVIYPVTFLPSAIATLLGGGATYKGNPAVMLVSTAAFRNEQY